MKVAAFKQVKLTQAQAEQLIELIACWKPEMIEVMTQTGKWWMPPHFFILMGVQGVFRRFLSGYPILLTSAEHDALSKVLTRSAQPEEVECLLTGDTTPAALHDRNLLETLTGLVNRAETIEVRVEMRSPASTAGG